jgi:hypothetical protein
VGGMAAVGGRAVVESRGTLDDSTGATGVPVGAVDILLGETTTLNAELGCCKEEGECRNVPPVVLVPAPVRGDGGDAASSEFVGGSLDRVACTSPFPMLLSRRWAEEDEPSIVALSTLPPPTTKGCCCCAAVAVANPCGDRMLVLSLNVDSSSSVPCVADDSLKSRRNAATAEALVPLRDK